MPRGIPNNPVKQVSPARIATPAKRRRRKTYPTQPSTLPPAQPMAQLSPMEATGAMSPAPSPSLRYDRHFAIITFRSGTLRGSVVEKMREDFAELNIKAIFVEHENRDGHAAQSPQVTVQSVYN